MLDTKKAQALDIVELTEDLPEYGLERGERGTVVEVFDDPEEAYMLEFVDNSGTSSRFADWVKASQIVNVSSTSKGQQAVQVFYSYSRKDESLRNELETHLKVLQRQGMIASWHDRAIEAGDEWKRKIDENLERADIILLLVSADFIASDYCYDIEMKRALERHESGEARVIPVVVRDVNWRAATFAKLQALPKDALAVTKWPDKDSAWRNVSEGIKKVARQVRRRHGKLRSGKR